MYPRNIVDVINQVISVIPPEDGSSLITELLSMRESAEFSAPELIYLRWQTGAEWLALELGDPTNLNEWQQKVFNIWMGRA